MATAKKTAPAKKTAAKPGTAVAVKKNTAVGAVVDLKERLRQQAAEMNSRVAPPSGLNITLAGKKFKFPDGTSTTDPTQFVVVDFLSENKFYDRPFDKENPVPPACFAIGTDPRGLVPSDNAPAKQADACSECPNNQFGSNGKGKACANGRLLAVLPADAHEATPLWLLRVSPTGLRSFDGFVSKVAGRLGMPPGAVVVTVAFDENSDYPKLDFGAFEPNENLEVFANRQDEARKLLETEPDVSGYEPPAPVRQAKAPAKQARR